MKNLKIIMAGLALLVSSSTFAATNYVTVFGGGTRVLDLGDTQKVSFNGNTAIDIKLEVHQEFQFNIGLAAGMKQGAYRGEVEFNCGRLTSKKLKVNAKDNNHEITNKKTGGIMRAMVNGYYDFHMDSMATPYAGVGVGYAFATHKYTNVKKAIDTNMFAYQAMFGVQLAVAKNVNVNVEYRFFGSAKTEFASKDVFGKDNGVSDKVFEHALMSHSVNLGVMFVIA